MVVIDWFSSLLEAVDNKLLFLKGGKVMEDWNWKRIRRQSITGLIICFVVINIYAVLYVMFNGTSEIADTLLRVNMFMIVAPCGVVFMMSFLGLIMSM